MFFNNPGYLVAIVVGAFPRYNIFETSADNKVFYLNNRPGPRYWLPHPYFFFPNFFLASRPAL